ncbi:hypothetical protein CDAR_478081 [Caerostris darwini]|uniref:LAGLIDADG homing endonuclease n=1 Tax=Caerostris darwini TaxID=1538125 RepID=A0AAV4Q313_9ARAC|nr:hypothetical protein CDAR_478081 [Caerostris darwini]
MFQTRVTWSLYGCIFYSYDPFASVLKIAGENVDHGTNSKLIRFAPFCFHNGKGDLVTRLGNVKKTHFAFGGESPDIFGEESFNKRWIIFVHDCAKNWITVFKAPSWNQKNLLHQTLNEIIDNFMIVEKEKEEVYCCFRGSDYI